LKRRRHNDISQDPRYKTKTSTQGGEECIASPDRIPDWIFPKVAQDALYKAGHGTAPDLIYARGIPDTPSPDPGAFDRKRCNLILIEVGFCRNFGCHYKLQEKTNKYAPLVESLQALCGKVEFVAIPVGHAGTNLSKTHHSLAQVIFATRPAIKRSRTRRQVSNPDTDTAVRSHDTTLFKSLLQTLTKLAQYR